MAESTATLTRVHILADLRRRSQYARTGALGTDQQADIDACIMQGENLFYKGTRLPGEASIHAWSFLMPLWEESLAPGEESCLLPDGFGGNFIESHLSVCAANVSNYQVRLVKIDKIKERQSAFPNHTMEYPELAAVQLRPRLQTTGQRFELVLWPTFTASFSLSGSYLFNPNITADSTPYPLGGQPFGLTLLQACRAIHEKEIDDLPLGPEYELFLRMYADDVAFDRKFNTEKYFGKNLDRSRFERQGYGRNSRHRGYGIEYDP